MGNPKWNRPTHEANRFAIMPGGTGSVCVPSTATRVVVEMWGQGGGGAGGCCCMWGCVGGQGGSYAYRVFSGATSPRTLGRCMLFCGCVCTCDCMSYDQSGHPGQCSWLRNCNTAAAAPAGSWYGVVYGGTPGYTYCTATSWVCSGCNPDINPQYDTGCMTSSAAIPQYFSICNMSTAQNGACNGGSCLCCAGSSCYCAANLCSVTYAGTQHTTAEACVYVGSTTTGLDRVFEPVACNCFDSYRLGACGWSKVQNLGYSGTWNYCDIGVGGASYAGGAQEKRNFSLGSFAYCGFAGNFPGGGGKSSAVCDGGCCWGSIGGGGLILISWA